MVREGAVATTAVVVHYLRDDLTDALVSDLRSVAAASVERVVVVDNGSPLPYTLEGHDPAVRVVRIENGLGFAGAVRVGRSHVPGRHFLLLNNDVRLEHDPLPALEARWHQGAALVGPRVEYPDGRFQLSWGDEISLAEERRERSRQRQMRSGGGPALSAREFESREPRRVDWLSGVALLVDTAAFDSVGGFDEKFFFYFEDVDLCRRLRVRGFHLWYEPAARVRHELGGTREAEGVVVSPNIAMAHVLGHLRYYRVHRSPLEAAVVKVLLLLQVMTARSYRRQPWRGELIRQLWRG